MTCIGLVDTVRHSHYFITQFEAIFVVDKPMNKKKRRRVKNLKKIPLFHLKKKKMQLNNV